MHILRQVHGKGTAGSLSSLTPAAAAHALPRTGRHRLDELVVRSLNLYQKRLATFVVDWQNASQSMQELSRQTRKLAVSALELLLRQARALLQDGAGRPPGFDAEQRQLVLRHLTQSSRHVHSLLVGYGGQTVDAVDMAVHDWSVDQLLTATATAAGVHAAQKTAEQVPRRWRWRLPASGRRRSRLKQL